MQSRGIEVQGELEQPTITVTTITYSKYSNINAHNILPYSFLVPNSSPTLEIEVRRRLRTTNSPLGWPSRGLSGTWSKGKSHTGWRGAGVLIQSSTVQCKAGCYRGCHGLIDPLGQLISRMGGGRGESMMAIGRCTHCTVIETEQENIDIIPAFASIV